MGKVVSLCLQMTNLQKKSRSEFFLLQIRIESLLKRWEITFLEKVCSQNFEISGLEVSQGRT